MRKLLTILCAVLALTATALGQSTLTLNSTTYTDPSSGYGVGPLNATFNPSLTQSFNITCFCVDYNDHVTYGETWNVNVFNLASYSGNQAPYEQAAYLTIQMGTTTDVQVIAAQQEAIWRIMLPGTTDPYLVNPQSTYWLNQAQSQTFAPGFASNITVYARQGAPGQEMISVVPEPGIIAIAFASLIGFGLWKMKRND